MADAMGWPPADEQALGVALASLAGEVAFPPTPPIAAQVATQLRDRAGRRSRLAPWSRWRIGRSLVFAVIALLILAGAAVAFGIVVGGLRITFAPGTPPPIPSGVVQSRAFGNEVGLQAARGRAGFTLVLPSLAGMGDPDHVYYNDFPTGGTVTLVWGARPGYAADSSGVGIVITEFAATVEPGAWEKMLFGGTTATRTVVDGATAYWVSGGPHALFYRDASGHPVDTSMRLVGDTLIWERDGLVIRVEGAPNLAAAAALGRTLR